MLFFRPETRHSLFENGTNLTQQNLSLLAAVLQNGVQQVKNNLGTVPKSASTMSTERSHHNKHETTQQNLGRLYD